MKKAGHEVHTNYKRTTYENETLRITLKPVSYTHLKLPTNSYV